MIQSRSVGGCQAGGRARLAVAAALALGAVPSAVLAAPLANRASLLDEARRYAPILWPAPGEPYLPAMLTMAGAPEHRAKFARATPEIGTQQPPLSAAYIGRFRNRIAAPDLAFIQRQAGRMMQRHGYAAEPLRLGRGDRLRFALRDWPLNLARMVGWQAVEMVQQFAPSRFGRKPGAETVVGVAKPNGEAKAV